MNFKKKKLFNIVFILITILSLTPFSINAKDKNEKEEHCVTAEYLNQRLEQIEDSETIICGAPGTHYKTEPKDFTSRGYEYVGMPSYSAPAEGEIYEKNDSVIYFNYDGIKTKDIIQVHYVNEDGTKIAEDKKITAKIGDLYKEEPIEIKNYTYQKLGNGSAPAEGIVEEDPKEITFVYQGEPKESSVVVHYINQNGDKLVDYKTISGNVGSDYEVLPEDLEWKGYDFDKITDGSAPLTGKITEDTQEVTLVYQGKPAKVKVSYRAQENIEIIDPIILEGQVGDTYKAEQKDFTDQGYDFVKVDDGSDPVEGKFSYVEEGNAIQRVIFRYEGQYREEAVRVKFVDQNGTSIMDDEFIEGYVGSGYDLSVDMIPEIEGYTYQKASDDSAPFTGIVTPDQQTITLIYQGNENESAVIVHYVNQNGDKIIADETISGNIGDEYKTEQKDLSADGYEFNKIGEGSAPTEGTITSILQEVTYIYQGNENKEAVKVHYVDKNGNKIVDDEIISGNIGDEYKTEQKDLSADGYEFDKMADDSASATGTITKETQEVTYVYQGNENKEAVKVHYVDENGTKIVDDEIISGNVGDTYKAEQKDLTNKGYEFDKIAEGTKEGIITNETQIVTFMYKDANHNGNSDIDNKDTKDTKNKSQNKKLPETGESNNFILSLFGMIILAIIGILIIKKYQK